MSSLKRWVARVGLGRVVAYVVGIALAVGTALAGQWISFAVLVIAESVAVIIDLSSKLRSLRRETDPQKAAIGNLLQGFSKHTDWDFKERDSRFTVFRNGDTETDHTLTVRVVGTSPFRFIELDNGGDFLEPREKDGIRFRVTDVNNLPLASTVAWRDEERGARRLSFAKVTVVFDDPVLPGQEAVFRLRYKWPRENPQFAKGEPCRIAHDPTTPTETWNCTLVLHRRVVSKALPRRRRSEDWKVGPGGFAGTAPPTVSQRAVDRGGREFTWTMADVDTDDRFVFTIQRP